VPAEGLALSLPLGQPGYWRLTLLGEVDVWFMLAVLSGTHRNRVWKKDY